MRDTVPAADEDHSSGDLHSSIYRVMAGTADENLFRIGFGSFSNAVHS